VLRTQPYSEASAPVRRWPTGRW